MPAMLWCAFAQLVVGGVVSASPDPAPQTVMWDGSLLLHTQQALAGAGAGAPELQPALQQLLAHADHWKNESDHGRTFSVMSKPAAGPSGDKHDFYSLGTYWWPNPNTSTGLPYIRATGW